jgi:SSS family solute:Na+ symporter
LLTCAFIYTSGILGAAWVSIIKDVMMIAAVGIVGIGVPHIYFGGIGRMFKALLEKYPGHLTFPGATANMDTLWVMSTVLLTGLGFYMWPHVFGSAFSAKSARTIRKNAIIMPFYQLPILLVFMVGFTALLVLPGLKNGDMAFLELVRQTYPGWFMGFVGAAGAVTAMVPASVLVLFAATLLAKNIYQAAFAPTASEERILRLSRLMVLVIMAAALLFALRFPNALVNLLLIGYDGVTQFFPGVVLGLFWKHASREGVLAGLLTGIGIAVVLVFSKNDPFLGMNAGFVALLANTLIAALVSLLSREKGRRPPGRSRKGQVENTGVY